MKELSTEEKAKRYNEAIEKAREELQACGSSDCDAARQIFRFFPELKEKEDEDERIREALLNTVKYYHPNESPYMFGISQEQIIAWLEKQGKKLTLEKVTKAFLEALSETPYNNMPIVQAQASAKQLLTFLTDPKSYNPDSEVKPKFHEGEWITNGDYTWKIIEIRPLVDYTLQSQDGSILDDTISHVDEHFHSFTIEDAKDGDVLTVDDVIFIYKRTLANHIVSYCKLINGIFESTIDTRTCCEGNTYVHPATKEQCNALMKAMNNAGYSFDFEKKELKLFITNGGDFESEDCEQKPAENKGMNLVEEEMTPFQKKVFGIIDTAIEEEQGLKQVCDELLALASDEIKQKPAEWSEEDEQNLNAALSYIKDEYLRRWLKDAIYNKYEKSAEWSEEDEGFFNLLLAIFTNEHPNGVFSTGNITVFKGNCVTSNRIITWLKSLKDRIQPKAELTQLDKIS